MKIRTDAGMAIVSRATAELSCTKAAELAETVLREISDTLIKEQAVKIISFAPFPPRRALEAKFYERAERASMRIELWLQVMTGSSRSDFASVGKPKNPANPGNSGSGCKRRSSAS